MPLTPLSISSWVQVSSKALAATSESARLDAEVILCWVLNKDRSYLFTWPEKELPAEQLEQLDKLLARRLGGEPVAYILGEKEFWSLPFYTNASTLIPRPDTEILVEQVLKSLPNNPQSILDLGTGTGAIAIALAHERPDCHIDAVDKSHEAVALAVKNSRRHQKNNLSVFHSDWFSSITRSYNVIISNPPYIDADDEHLAQGDVVFEPRSALVSDAEGLADINYIVDHAQAFLLPGGLLAIEHGYQQGSAVQGVFSAAGYLNIATVKDYGGNERVTFGIIRTDT